MFDAFLDELDKIAKRRLTKFLEGKKGKAKIDALKKLPKKLREEQAYKILGDKAQKTVKKMSDKGGHGKGHVFEVTKGTQELMKGQSTEAKRRGTLGSLLHDVARTPEGKIKKQLKKKHGKKEGKRRFEADTSSYHSELGGRYAKNFVKANKPVASMVPGLNKGKLSGVVRAHDTDIHSLKPWTAKRMVTDPAAKATYMSDKATGFGLGGAKRTVAMGHEFGETPKQTANFALKKNMPKYRKVIGMASPQQQQVLRPQLQAYQSSMRRYGRRGTMPGFQPTNPRQPAGVAQPQPAPVAQTPVRVRKPVIQNTSVMPTGGKVAVAAAKDFGRLYKARTSGKISTKQLKRLATRLATRSRSKNVKADLFKALNSVPASKQKSIIDLMASVLGSFKSKKRRGYRRR